MVPVLGVAFRLTMDISAFQLKSFYLITLVNLLLFDVDISIFLVLRIVCNI